jgi:uncharacterized membrane protein YqhA
MTDPQPPARPADGRRSAGARRDGTRRARHDFEQGLGLVQLTVLLPVVVLAISGVGAFVYGTAVAIHSTIDIARHPFAAHNLRLFLTEIDLFLIGATLIIAAFGLYELFVSKINPASLRMPLPGWLVMSDLNDLKARVISMIILVVAVSFVDVLLEFGSGLKILYLGAGVAIFVVSLTVYLRFGSDANHQLGSYTIRANRRSAAVRAHLASGRITCPARRPSAGGSGSWRSSVQRNSHSGPSPRTSKIPRPRISQPVCLTTHRRGGSHSVITIVSVKPTGPRPVRPVTVAPTLWPPCTAVAQTHSCCRDQSVATSHTRSGLARTRTCATIFSGLLTATNLSRARQIFRPWRVHRPGAAQRSVRVGGPGRS